jgi:hypothetical protein
VAEACGVAEELPGWEAGLMLCQLCEGGWQMEGGAGRCALVCQQLVARSWWVACTLVVVCHHQLTSHQLLASNWWPAGEPSQQAVAG